MTETTFQFVNRFTEKKESFSEVLQNIPDKFTDAGPEEIENYINSKYQAVTKNEIDSLVASYIVKQLSGLETLRTNQSNWLATIKNNLKNKYQWLGSSPDHPLWPYLELAALAELRNKKVIVFN